MGPIDREVCSGDGDGIVVEFIQCMRRRFPKGWQKGSLMESIGHGSHAPNGVHRRFRVSLLDGGS